MPVTFSRLKKKSLRYNLNTSILNEVWLKKLLCRVNLSKLFTDAVLFYGKITGLVGNFVIVDNLT